MTHQLYTPAQNGRFEILFLRQNAISEDPDTVDYGQATIELPAKYIVLEALYMKRKLGLVIHSLHQKRGFNEPGETILSLQPEFLVFCSSPSAHLGRCRKQPRTWLFV